MTKEEVITKLKSTLSFQDKVDIFNWYIQNEAGERYATFEQLPGKEFKLSEQTITGVKGQQGLAMLDYSMAHIKRILNEVQK